MTDTIYRCVACGLLSDNCGCAAELASFNWIIEEEADLCRCDMHDVLCLTCGCDRDEHFEPDPYDMGNEERAGAGHLNHCGDCAQCFEPEFGYGCAQDESDDAAEVLPDAVVFRVVDGDSPFGGWYDSVNFEAMARQAQEGTQFRQVIRQRIEISLTLEAVLAPTEECFTSETILADVREGVVNLFRGHGVQLAEARVYGNYSRLEWYTP